MNDRGRALDPRHPDELPGADGEEALLEDRDALQATDAADAAAIPQDMVALLDETADLADPVELAVDPRGTTYLLGGRAFAWASGMAFEVQLGPDIASAALRTPDVTPSGRGAGWIRLEPRRIDDHAADRVVAWFEMARRIAVGRRAKPDPPRRH